jgi:membrane protein DedA with SNARE-associated domain
LSSGSLALEDLFVAALVFGPNQIFHSRTLLRYVVPLVIAATTSRRRMSEGCDVDNLVRSTIAFVQDHQAWGVPIVFVLAFCESFAFVSLLVPATGILLGVGGLIAAAELGFWPMWFAAALGAIVGDWLAYWLAFHFKDRVLQTWPLAGNPDLVARGVGFFKKWGMLAVFVGRFFGPFRAVVPLIAGLNAMPWLNFQIANVVSAAVWAAGILLPGFIGVRWLME